MSSLKEQFGIPHGGILISKFANIEVMLAGNQHSKCENALLIQMSLFIQVKIYPSK